MRIIVVGAGAVGGVVAANLAMAGTPVIAVARGEHGRVMRESGLRYESPTGTTIVELPVAASVGEIDITDDDVFLLGVKRQDTIGALNDLRTAGAGERQQRVVEFEAGNDSRVRARSARQQEAHFAPRRRPDPCCVHVVPGGRHGRAEAELLEDP